MSDACNESSFLRSCSFILCRLFSLLNVFGSLGWTANNVMVLVSARAHFSKYWIRMEISGVARRYQEATCTQKTTVVYIHPLNMGSQIEDMKS